MPRFFRNTPTTLVLTGIFLLIAYAGYTQSWAFSGKDMGASPPPLAGIFQHIPYAWETWVILISPLVLMLRLVGAEEPFNQGPAWLFWILQGLYFYALAAILAVPITKLTHRNRTGPTPLSE